MVRVRPRALVAGVADPGYVIGELLPCTRDRARRLGLVTLRQMVTALAFAVENPPADRAVSILDVPAIRAANID